MLLTDNIEQLRKWKRTTYNTWTALDRHCVRPELGDEKGLTPELVALDWHHELLLSLQRQLPDAEIRMNARRGCLLFFYRGGDQLTPALTISLRDHMRGQL